MTYVVFFAVSLLASIVGAICGVGGGVFMKPALDAVAVLPVNTITFLSTCTVASMAAYNVMSEARNARIGKSQSLIDWNLTTWLAIGSAIGGIVGKVAYGMIKDSFADKDMVGGYQALALFVAIVFTFIYSINRHKIKGKHVHKPISLLLLGFSLGTISSFVGIGGGPMNMAVLYYFLSMTTKVAAQNSIYMILISQASSLITTFIQGGIPSGFYESNSLGLWMMLIGMILCGIGGGMLGKKINKKLSSETVDRLFIFLLFIIMGLCLYTSYTKLVF